MGVFLNNMPPPVSKASERTPLLQQEQQPTQDGQQTSESLEDGVLDFALPSESYIFTEVIQSPFDFISDEMNFTIRVIIAINMTAILGAYFLLEYRAGNAKIFSFRLMNIIWATQCFYMWLVSIWAYISISTDSVPPYPRPPHHPYTQSNLRTRLLPILTRSHIPKILFRSLYTIVTTTPFPSMFFYLFILLPNPNTPSYPAVLPELFMAIVSSIIAFCEIFILNSITPVPGRRCSHYLEQVIFLALYAFLYTTLWVWLGNVAIGMPVDAELDWRLLGGFEKGSGVVVIEIVVAVVIYFYGVVEFFHCCKYYCFR